MRVGAGVPEADVELGYSIIKACTEAGSAVGLCKPGALHEMKHDEVSIPVAINFGPLLAFECYVEAAALGSSALGYFNLGWSHVHGIPGE